MHFHDGHLVRIPHGAVLRRRPLRRCISLYEGSNNTFYICSRAIHVINSHRQFHFDPENLTPEVEWREEIVWSVNNPKYKRKANSH